MTTRGITIHFEAHTWDMQKLDRAVLLLAMLQFNRWRRALGGAGR